MKNWEQEERERFEIKIDQIKKQKEEKRKEDAYYKKNQKFLNAIRQGNIILIEEFLQSNFTPNDLIFYRTNKAEYWDCGPVWQERNTTPLEYALETEQDKSALFLIQKGAQIPKKIAGSLLQLGFLKKNTVLTEKVLEKITLLAKKEKEEQIQKNIHYKRENRSR